MIATAPALAAIAWVILTVAGYIGADALLRVVRTHRTERRSASAARLREIGQEVPR